MEVHWLLDKNSEIKKKKKMKSPEPQYFKSSTFKIIYIFYKQVLIYTLIKLTISLLNVHLIFCMKIKIIIYYDYQGVEQTTLKKKLKEEQPIYCVCYF